MAKVVNTKLRILKSKKFTYNQSGYANLVFIFDNKTTDIKLKPGDYVKISYTNERLQVVEEKATIRSVTYDFDGNRNDYILKINVETAEEGIHTIHFSALYDIIMLVESTLLDGEVLDDNVKVISSKSSLDNVGERQLCYVQSEITAKNGQLLTRGLYIYIDGYYVSTTSASSDTNSNLGDYRVLDSQEEMNSIAPYNGLMVAVPVRKSLLGENTVGSSCNGVQIVSAGTLANGPILEVSDASRSIFCKDGKIYYKGENNEPTSSSVVLYDGENVINTDKEGFIWFPVPVRITSINTDIFNINPVYIDNVTYKYENQWVVFEPGSESGSSGGSTTTGINSAFVVYSTYLSFPTIGDGRIFYIDDSTNILYRWNESKLKYYPMTVSSSGGDIDIEIIDCGSSKLS